MTEQNPPGFLQNAGSTHTAEQMRNWLQGITAGSSAANSLVGRGGVHPTRGFNLVVTQTGSPSMAVIIRSGQAMLPGTEGARQGLYSVLNDADVTLSISAAHATLNRIDLVCYKAQDTAYSGAVNSSSLVVVTGTPASSPVAPAAPADSLTLAQVFVGASVTSILNANITDTRIWLAGLGGLILAKSTARPGAGTVQNGQMIFESDTLRTYQSPDGGTTWNDMTPMYKARQTLGGTAASVTFSGIPSNLRRLSLRWTARSNDASTNVLLQLRVNNDSGANYYDQFVAWTGSGAAGPNLETGATQWRIGRQTAGGATANMFGSGMVEIVGWDSPHTNYLGATWWSQAMSGGQIREDGGGSYAGAGPYTRLDVICTTGSFIAGSDFQLEGVYT